MNVLNMAIKTHLIANNYSWVMQKYNEVLSGYGESELINALCDASCEQEEMLGEHIAELINKGVECAVFSEYMNQDTSPSLDLIERVKAELIGLIESL